MHIFYLQTQTGQRPDMVTAVSCCPASGYALNADIELRGQGYTYFNKHANPVLVPNKAKPRGVAGWCAYCGEKHVLHNMTAGDLPTPALLASLIEPRVAAARAAAAAAVADLATGNPPSSRRRRSE